MMTTAPVAFTFVNSVAMGVGGGLSAGCIAGLSFAFASPHTLISFSDHHTKAQASQRRAHTATLPCVPLGQLAIFCAWTLMLW